MKKRRLYFDIETSYLICKSFYIGRKVFLDYKSIIQENKIICICYKWDHEKKVRFLTWDKNQDDKKMLQEFIKVANMASEMIAHNGDRFDLTWIRTRCLKHGIEMFPNYVTIDTLKASRSKFRFPSNKLDYIGRYLGIGQKVKVDGDLWDGVILKKSERALTRMVQYCKRDVLLLERVYNIMKNHLLPKVHYSDKGNCPECGSGHLKNVCRRITAAGTTKQQYQCQDCGKHHTITAKKAA